MNKKLVAILVGVLAVVAIIIVGVIGTSIDNVTKNYRVQRITLADGTYDSTRIVDDLTDYVVFLDEDQNTYQLQLVIKPDAAKDKSVAYTTSNPEVATIDQNGLVTFLRKEPVSVIITSKDGSSISISVSFYFQTQNSSQLSASFVNGNLNLELIENKLHQFESNQLILFKGVEYFFNLDEGMQIELEGEPEATLENALLLTTNTETFSLKFFDDENEQTVSVKVIPYLNNFSYGSQYSLYRQTTNGIESSNDFLDKTVKPYNVGNANPFKFNLKLESNNLETIKLEDVELTYTVYDGQNLVSINDIATVSNNSIVFNTNAIGKTYTIEILPKYNILNKSKLSFQIKVNNGVNVWTHEELKEAFKDLNVTTINLHSNIVAKLDEDQINNDDGTARNFDEIITPNGTYLKTGSVYARGAGNNTEGVNTLDFYGNYFNINGENLPLSNITERPAEFVDGVGYKQFHALPWTGGAAAGQKISSVHVAIFSVHDARSNSNSNSDLVVNFNDLKVIGNSSKSPIYSVEEHEQGIDLNEEEEVKRLARQGSAYLGLKTFFAKITTNNVAITKSVISLFSNQGELDINKTSVYDIWSIATYGFSSTLGAEITLTNSRFTELGGPIVTCEDSSYTDENDPEEKDLILTINEGNVFDNLLTGTEGWFVVNGYTTAATRLKSQVEEGINQVGKSVIKTKTINNINHEMLNLLFIVSGTDTLNKNEEKGRPVDLAVQFTLKRAMGFDGQGNRIYDIVKRRNGDVASHPFNQDGKLLMPMGEYSDLSNFKKLQHSIALVNGYLTNDDTIMTMIYNNTNLTQFTTPLKQKIEDVFQQLTNYQFSSELFASLNEKQSVLLEISAQCVTKVQELISAIETAQPNQATQLKTLAETNPDTANGAFAILTLTNPFEQKLLEINATMNVGDMGDLNLIVVLEYFD